MNSRSAERLITTSASALLMLSAAATGAAARSGGIAALPRKGVHVSGLSTTFDVLMLIAAGIALTAVVGLVALVARRPGRGSDEYQISAPPLASRWSRAAASLLAITLLTAPVAVLIGLAHHDVHDTHAAQTTHQMGHALPGSRPSQTPHTAGGDTGGGSGRVFIIAAVVAGAGAIGLVSLRAHRVGLRDRTDHSMPPLEDEPALADIAVAGVSAARLAVAAPGSAREAVINGYVAMTRALTATAGDATDRVLTPRRLLLRAAAAGLMDVSAVRVIVDRFEMARFSRHRVTDDDRRRVESALDELHRQLGRTQGQHR